jgi:hypothetical protein
VERESLLSRRGPVHFTTRNPRLKGISHGQKSHRHLVIGDLSRDPILCPHEFARLVKQIISYESTFDNRQLTRDVNHFTGSAEHGFDILSERRLKFSKLNPTRNCSPNTTGTPRGLVCNTNLNGRLKRAPLWRQEARLKMYVQIPTKATSSTFKVLLVGEVRYLIIFSLFYLSIRDTC